LIGNRNASNEKSCGLVQRGYMRNKGREHCQNHFLRARGFMKRHGGISRIIDVFSLLFNFWKWSVMPMVLLGLDNLYALIGHLVASGLDTNLRKMAQQVQSVRSK
jgi:hypothetical protein